MNRDGQLLTMAMLKTLFTCLIGGMAIILLNPSTSVYAQRGSAVKPPDANVREARRLLLQAKANALKIKNGFQRDLVLDEIGVAQARAGALEAAILTANSGRFTLSDTLTEIGKQLAKTEDLTRAQFLGKRLKEGNANAILTHVVDGQLALAKPELALISASVITNPEIRSYALEKIAVWQAATGDSSGARKTFSQARNAHPSGLVSLDELELAIVITQLSRGEVSAARTTIESQAPEQKFLLMIGAAEELWKKGKRSEAIDWLETALKGLPVESKSEFLHYMAIPVQVKLGRRDAAMGTAAALSPELRLKGYMAVAVTAAESKDLSGVEDAVKKMRLVALADQKKTISNFMLQLMTLNVTAALIDNGQISKAEFFLNDFDQRSEDVSFSMGVEPRLQLQRVLILALKNKFTEARSLALEMRPNSITDVERGSALRLTSLLETKASGSVHTLGWARALPDIEDRVYALVGIAQALLEMDDVKLGYTSIMVH